MLIAAARIITAASPAGASARGLAPVLAPGYVAWQDGRITAVGAGQPPSRLGKPDVLLADGVLLPGFVDLQVNGYFGVEFSMADAAGWTTVLGRLPATGTTALMPTVITSPFDQMRAALSRAAATLPALAATSGAAPIARVLGIHLEGPFISTKRPGAHNPAWMLTPDSGRVDELLAAGSGLVKLVTMAPELDGAMAAIKHLAASGVLVSVGHSDATAQQVSAAAMNGARMVTHLFNAQRPMHHREPGVVGQALSDGRLVASLIADLHHVYGQVAAIAFAAAPGRICLVTDAAACAGMPAGRYVLGGEPIELTEGEGEPPVRLDGTIAGSALRMDSAVANMVAVGVSLADAVAAATRIPADLIGRTDLGRIAVSATADLSWLSDDLRARATWIAGQQVYGAPLG
jgi:N-acetylglucosamine-6-phosphate deacetylase